MLRRKTLRNETELQCAGNMNYTFQGNKFELRELGVKYDYSVCNDSVINELYAEMETLKVKIKERETFLKGISTADVVNRDTGEKIYPPRKTSTTGVVVTLK